MSKILYCSSINGSATKATLNKLTPIQTQGLRIRTGAFRSSPRNSIICESGEIPLNLQIEYYTMKNALKILQSDSPTRKLFNDNMSYGNLQPPFPTRAKKLIENSGLHIIIPAYNIKEIPPWKLKPTKICTGLFYLNKKQYSTQQMKQHAIEYLRRKHNTLKIFTDGSKQEKGTGFAVHSNEKNIQYSLPKSASIFTAESMAIIKSSVLWSLVTLFS